MKKLFMLIACLLACGTSFAQKLNKVSGKVVNEKAEVLPFAMVKLASMPDTTLVVKNQQTSNEGTFTFNQLPAGNYRLSVSLLGYKNEKLSTFTLTNQDLSLPAIKLASTIKLLKELTVEGKKSFVEHRIDKTVLNVENSIVATGGTALDVLEKAPGVSIDRQNDQIKLNNKAGITIMIDGKPNVLSGADVTTLLGNMSSDQIATIELITNPSSKYEAAGNAGIINIKLKRNKAFGTNGTLSLNGGQALMPNSPTDLYRAGLFLNLNHRVNSLNIFGNAGVMRKANFNNIVVNRSTLANGLASAFNQNFERANKGLGYTGKIGADYYVSDRTVLGVMVDANTVNTDLTNYSNTFINEVKSNVATSNSVNQNAYSKSPASNLTANFNIKHDFKKEGSNLTFDADYAGFNNEKNEVFNANYLNATGQLNQSTALRNNTEAKIDVYAAKTDLTLTISKSLKWEAGLKSSYVVTNNDFISEQLLNGTWQNDKGKSNNFIYKENINAAYTNLAKEWKKWQVQVGLRAEYTHSNGNSITENKVVDRNYLSVFPTAFVNQVLTDHSNMRYSYSRRVDRPNYQQLNPFVFYMDPYALDQGNPYLKPQFTDNFEVSFSYKEFSVSFNYSDSRDMITQISQQNDVTRVINVIRENLGRAQNYSANLFYPIKPTKFWNMQNNVSVYYNKFDDGNLEGGQFNSSKVAYNLNSNQSFTLPKNFTVEINFWLNSPRVNGVEQTTITQYAVNAGVQKSLMNKKLKLRLNIDDIFLTNHWEGKLAYQNVNMQVVNRYTSRRAAFNISYAFGNQNVKSARSRNTATEDMKGRAGGN